jgi:hypothetical protein
LNKIVFEQASRYRQRFGGRRIPPLPNLPPPYHPDLIPVQSPNLKDNKQELEENSTRRIIEMHLALEKGLSSLDVSQIVIGVNQMSQSPQDFSQSYSQGSQTEIVMVHDVSTETRKLTLDSTIQCDNYTLEMYTQTEIAFMKNKNIQVAIPQLDNFAQTDKTKSREAVVQTVSKLYSDKCQQVAEHVDVSTETELTNVYNQGTFTDNLEVYEIKSELDDSESNKQSIQNNKEKSDSPPLTPDKAVAGPSSPFTFPFCSLFNPLAVRLPAIGTYNFYRKMYMLFLSQYNMFVTNKH